VIYRVEVGEPDRLIVRGVRYLDELRREGDEWRISRRYHTADWAFETTASLGIDPSGRPAHPLLPFPMG
jgi:hypothetical protein